MNESDQPTTRLPVELPPPLTIRRAMGGRDVREAHRVSSPLELLFDLTVVVAVAAAASRLHHGLLHDGLRDAAVVFAQSFFVIWWPWMSFTWFASAYDTDDVPFRLATLVQMIGVLLIAVGISADADAGVAGIVGFFLMRATLIVQWWRASLDHPERRRTCRRYALAIAGLQFLWLLRAAWVPPEWRLATFCALAILEVAVPLWVARAGDTPWHAHHVAERFGLLTIILLGECMMAAAAAASGVLESRGWSVDLAIASISIVGLIMGLWWSYFLVPFGQVLHQHRDRGFLWGYGHVLVFGPLAALGGVLEVVAEALKVTVAYEPGEHVQHQAASAEFTLALVGATVAVFFAALWWLGGQTTRRHARNPKYLAPVLLASLSGWAVVWLNHSVPWGLFVVASGPALLIGWVTRDRRLQPERFAVR